MNDVLRRRRSEFNRAGKDHEIVDRHIGYNLLQGACPPFILNQRIEEASPMHAIDVGPLRFVLIAKNDAVAVPRLDAEDAARREDGVIDLREPAVGAGNDEIMQDVRAAPAQGGAYAKIADPVRDE